MFPFKVPFMSAFSTSSTDDQISLRKQMSTDGIRKYLSPDQGDPEQSDVLALFRKNLHDYRVTHHLPIEEKGMFAGLSAFFGNGRNTRRILYVGGGVILGTLLFNSFSKRRSS